MFQLSFTVLLALSISANYVFTIEVFEADTANLQNESPVGVLKNNNQTKESPKLHEEPSKNDTRINSTLEKDQRKVDTSQAKNVTTLTITLSTQNDTRNSTKPNEETITKEEIVTKKPGKVSDKQANVNPPQEDKKDVTIETSKENSTSINNTLGTVVSSNNTIANKTNPENASSQPDFYPVKDTTNESSNITGSLNGSIYKTFPPELDHVTEATKSKISNSTVVTTLTTNTTSPATVIIKTTSPVTVSTKTTPVTVTTKPTPVTVTTKPTPVTVTTKPTPVTVTTKPTPVTVTTKPTPVTVTTAIVNTTDATNVSTTLQNNQKKNGNNRMAVEGVGDLQQAELTEKGKESNDESNNRSMPPGIIALVTAISFAVAIAIGYISMVVWKQYLEHRYGRRELLVNELEFDTNDLRHFEL